MSLVVILSLTICAYDIEVEMSGDLGAGTVIEEFRTKVLRGADTYREREDWSRERRSSFQDERMIEREIIYDGTPSKERRRGGPRGNVDFVRDPDGHTFHQQSPSKSSLQLEVNELSTDASSDDSSNVSSSEDDEARTRTSTDDESSSSRPAISRRRSWLETFGGSPHSRSMDQDTASYRENARVARLTQEASRTPATRRRNKRFVQEPVAVGSLSGHTRSDVVGSYSEDRTKDQTFFDFSTGVHRYASWKFRIFETLTFLNLYNYQDRLVKLDKTIRNVTDNGGHVSRRHKRKLARLLRHYRIFLVS